MFKHLQSLQWNKLHSEKVSQVCETHLVQERLYSQKSRKTKECCASFMKGFNLCVFFASSAMSQTDTFHIVLIIYPKSLRLCLCKGSSML